MSIGKKIFLAVGLLILVIVVCQGALTTFMVKGNLEQSALNDLQGQTEAIVDQLSDLVAQTEADLEIMRAHKATEDYLTFLLFEDPDSMGQEVDKLEAFFKRVLDAKPHYSKLQLVGHNTPSLQLSAGKRLETFETYDYAVGLEQLESQLNNGGRGIIHHFRGTGDSLTIVSVAALVIDGMVEGMVWLEQPIGIRVGNLLDKISRQNYFGVISDGSGALVAYSRDLDLGVAEQLSRLSNDDWVGHSLSLPAFNWDTVVATRKTDAYAVVNELIVTVVVIVIVSLIAAVMVLGASTVLFVTRPINRITRRMQDIAEGGGDLTVSLEADSQDEIGQLAAAFNHFVGRIRTTVGGVKDTIHVLNGEAGQLQGACKRAKNAAEQQQAETSQIATAAEQMSSTSQEVGRITSDAEAATQLANSKSAEGKQVVASTITAIGNLATEVESASNVVEKLARDSQDVTSILEVIRGVADQTNLLALNAAIEAARAGEHGRGFAVVADEVRLLAQNTQDSTAQIQDIITRLQKGAEDAVKVMENGREKAAASVDQVAQVEGTFTHIEVAVSQVNDLNTQIASASEEQGAVTEDVNRSISAISQMAAESTEVVETTAESIGQLADMAHRLDEAVRQFKV